MTVRISNMTATFANLEIDYTAIGMDVTDEASGANSVIIDLKVANSTMFNVRKDGTVGANSINTNSVLTVAATANSIVTNALQSEAHVSNSVTATSIMTQSITTSILTVNAVTSTVFAANSVTLSETVTANAVVVTYLEAANANANILVANSVVTNSLRLNSGAVPLLANSTGTQGTIAWDAAYIYVCVATDTWVRAPLATWI